MASSFTDEQFPIARIICAVATEKSLTCRELLTGGLAESDLNPLAENPSDGHYGSYGCFQQNFDFAPEMSPYTTWDVQGNYHLNPPAGFVDQLKLTYRDTWHAARVAADAYLRLRRTGDSPVDVWSRYNGPSYDPAVEPARWLYEMCWDKAGQLLADPRMGMEDETVIAELKAQIAQTAQEDYVIVAALRKEIATLRAIALPDDAAASVGAIEAAANSLERYAAARGGLT